MVWVYLKPAPTATLYTYAGLTLNLLTRSAQVSWFDKFILPDGVSPPVALPVPLLVVARFVAFFFHAHRDPLAIGDQSLPVDVAPGDHSQVAINRFPYFIGRIPIFAEGEAKRLVNVIQPFVNPAHAALNVL